MFHLMVLHLYIVNYYHTFIYNNPQTNVEMWETWKYAITIIYNILETLFGIFFWGCCHFKFSHLWSFNFSTRFVATETAEKTQLGHRSHRSPTNRGCDSRCGLGWSDHVGSLGSLGIGGGGGGGGGALPWWSNPYWLVVKNHGVRHWGWDYPIYEMENNKCLKPPTSL